MSLTVALPLLTGGLAGYASKKTGKSYFYEKSVVGALGYTAGLITLIGESANTRYSKGVILAICLLPAAVVGSSLYIGNLVGHVANDALN